MRVEGMEKEKKYLFFYLNVLKNLCDRKSFSFADTIMIKFLQPTSTPDNNHHNSYNKHTRFTIHFNVT